MERIEALEVCQRAEDKGISATIVLNSFVLFSDGMFNDYDRACDHVRFWGEA